MHYIHGPLFYITRIGDKEMHNKTVAFLVLTLTILLSSNALAIWDFLADFPKPDDYIDFRMSMGYWNERPVWYILLEASDIQFARLNTGPNELYNNGLTYDAKLASAQETPASNRVFVVTNGRFCRQPWIFDTVPNATDTTYSGLWRVVYVRFVNPNEAVPIKSYEQIEQLLIDGKILISNIFGGTGIDFNKDFTIIDAPIIAVGKLDGPWWPAPNRDEYDYRLKQVRAENGYAYSKIVYLPVWYVFAQESISGRIRVVQCLIPDLFEPGVTSNPAPPGTLADRIGANAAPGLDSVPEDDTQIFYEVYSGEYNDPQRPPAQFPIIEDYPFAGCWPMDQNPFSWRNLNRDYSAVMRHVVLMKVFGDDELLNEILRKITIDNTTTIIEYIPDILDDEFTGIRLNAPVVPPILDKPQPEAWIINGKER